MRRRFPEHAVVWLDGRAVPGEDARVPVFDRGFLYGDSIYEVTRTVGGAPLFLAEHLDRLERSARGIEMELPPPEPIRQAVAETLAALLPGSAERAYLRIVVTRGAGDLDLDPAAADEPRLLVVAKPLKPPDVRLYDQGVRLALVPWRRNAPGHVPATVKSGNYLSSVMAVTAAKRAGAYEALLCDLDGYIAEGASSNFFWVRGGQVQTPPVSIGILSGITREVVLRVAAAAGIPVGEGMLHPAELGTVEEAFLTSSVRGVVPVVQVDQVAIAGGRPGPLTRRIMTAYGERIGEAPPGVPWK